LPEEGKTRIKPEMNRTMLEDGAPDAIARVDAKWGELIRNWKVPA
jgi:hypothetical protein